MPATPMKKGCERWRRLARAVPGESAGRLPRQEWLPGDCASCRPSLPCFSGDRLPPPQLLEDTSLRKSSFRASTPCGVPGPFTSGAGPPAADADAADADAACSTMPAGE